MKKTSFFLYFLLVFFALLCFSSCAFDFGALMPGATTAPTTTTVSPVTTTSPITTAPVTTTAPAITTAPQISQNPIKSVSLSSDGGRLTLKYSNNISQNLLTDVGVREGFNSAFLLDYDFDTDNRILSLTYQASVALNRAEIILENEGAAPITLYLREMNGRLEFCKDPSKGNWSAFAPANRASAVDGVPILAALLNLAEYGMKEETIVGNGVIFTVKQETEATKTQHRIHADKTNGAYLRFRATEWQKEGYDYVTDARLHGSTNHNFNITNDYEIPESTPFDQIAGGTLFKSSGDDIKPVNFNGTAIGANHGYYIVAAIPNSTGLTEEDIGSVWQMSSKKFVLVALNQGNAWFCPFDNQMMESGIFNYIEIPAGAALTHVSGAMHTSPITASSTSVQTQLNNATNHVTQHAYLNGKSEIDLTKDGVYECEFIDFHETYDILYLPEALTYLMENVGHNTNESCYSDEIKEAYVSFDVTYRFHKNGAMVMYNEYIFEKDVLVQSIGGVQSCKMPTATQYVYIPATTVANTPIPQVDGQRIEWGNDEDLVDPAAPPTTYFQMTSSDGETAMNTGFYPLYGDARAEVRLSFPKHKYSHGWCHSTQKMYPLILRSNEGIPMEAGKSFSTITYRAPSIKTDEDMLAVNHYWVGDEIVLSLHTQKVLDGKEITLPDYMNGMTVSVIEKSESMTLGTTVIENGKIAFSTNNAGYAIVKLSPAK